MMFEPISALSIAAAAVQFIDFSSKLVCKSSELCKSIDGVLPEHKQTETVTLRLKALTQELQASHSSRRASTLAANVRLKNICTECNNVSDALVERLRRLRVPDGTEGRKWKSFRQALKSVASKKEIDGMARRLTSLRAEIDSEVLFLMRESLQDMASQTTNCLDQLRNQNRDIIELLLKAQLSYDQFSQRFEELDQEHKSEFERLSTLSVEQNTRFQRLDETAKSVIVMLMKQQHRIGGHSEKFDEVYKYSGKSDAPTMRKTATALVIQDGEKRASRVRLDILESLRFPEMSHRHEGIADAHAQTFAWVFKDPTKHQKPWSNFSHWLSQQSAMYWIQGKPASGKSTLMRYIWHHPSTHQHLRAWAGDSSLITAAFFFWNSGSEKQRSQSGLFRTLLYEILQHHRGMIARAFPEEWQRKSDLAANDMTIEPETWTKSRLQKAFEQILNLANANLKFCFFIDGLDEYDGDYGEIAEYFEVLSKQSPHVKVCVSSRPLTVIEQVFSGCCSLKLQDLTVDDVKRYVGDKFRSDRGMQRLILEDSASVSMLITQIVSKASGVFLWVTLVVKLLINGVRNGDDMSHLIAHLSSLHPDLEKLFEHILEKIEPCYREDSSKIFQIVRASNLLSLLGLFRALLYTDYHGAVELAIQGHETFTSQHYKQRLKRLADQMTRRLNSRCRGLLEVNDFNPTEPVNSTTEDMLLCYHHGKAWWDADNHSVIVYLHRTARDFLEQEKVWRRIQEQTAKSKFDPHLSLLISSVVQVKTSPISNVFEKGEQWLGEIAGFGMSASEQSIKLVDELDRVLSFRAKEQGLSPEWCKSFPEDPRPLSWGGDVISLAIECGLIWYAHAKSSYDASPAYIAATKKFPLPYLSKRRDGLPLLAYALSFHRWRYPASTEVHLDLARSLLQNGSDPNEIFQGFSIWQYVLFYVHRCGSLDGGRGMRSWIPVLLLLLQHGADPRACCVDDEDLFQKSIGYQDDECRIENHLEISIDPQESRKRRECDPSNWNPNNTHAYFHSVTAVIDDIPQDSSDSSLAELKLLLETKKKTRDRTSRKRRKRTHGTPLRRPPGWTS